MIASISAEPCQPTDGPSTSTIVVDLAQLQILIKHTGRVRL